MMTTALAKTFVALSLAFVILTALTGSAYYIFFGYASIAIMFSVAVSCIVRSSETAGRRQLRHV